MNLDGIRKARKAAGFTQEALAKKLCVTRSLISKYENGTISPTLGQLGKIALALNTTVSEMIGSDWSGIDMSDAMDPFTTFSDDVMMTTIKKAQQERKAQLIASFDTLNEDGQLKAIERVEELAEVPRYRKEQPDASPKQEPTEEE